MGLEEQDLMVDAAKQSDRKPALLFHPIASFPTVLLKRKASIDEETQIHPHSLQEGPG